MIFTHLIAFDFWPGAGVSDVVPAVETPTGGGGGRKRFKSWDQRQRERLEEIAKAKPAPQPILATVREMRPYKTLSPASVKAYANARAQDDEEAMHVIMAIL